MANPPDVTVISGLPLKKALDPIVTTDFTVAPGESESREAPERRMTMTLEIKTAAELIDPGLEARWATRHAGRETAILQGILRQFVERPGPVAVEGIGQAFPERSLREIREALRRLDE